MPHGAGPRRFGDDFGEDDAGFGAADDEFGAVGDNEGFGDDGFDAQVRGARRAAERQPPCAAAHAARYPRARSHAPARTPSPQLPPLTARAAAPLAHHTRPLQEGFGALPETEASAKVDPEPEPEAAEDDDGGAEASTKKEKEGPKIDGEKSGWMKILITKKSMLTIGKKSWKERWFILKVGLCSRRVARATCQPCFGHVRT